MYEFRKMRLNKLISFVMFIVLILKVCSGSGRLKEFHKSSNSKDVSTKSSTNTKNESLTSYYRYEPYGPQTHAFGFEINDNKTGNRQFRDERRFNNGTVEGSYGYVRPDGLITITHFIAGSKTGYLIETRSFEQTHEIEDQIDWQANVWSSDNFTDIFMQHPNDQELDINTTKALEAEHNIDINHIDSAKDLLSPSVWDIVSGKLPLKEIQVDDGKAKKLGFETFENVIPKDFPIVSFKLPEKTIKSSLINATINNETIAEKMTEPTKSMVNESETDLISKVVNETRKEFLENLPNLL